MNKIPIKTSIHFEEEPGEVGHLNFLGYSPCVFKHTFKESLDGVLGVYRKEAGDGFRSYVPSGCDSCGSDMYDDIWKTPNIEDFPDVVTSLGFGDFFREGFVERFVNKGYFKSAWNTPLTEPFEKAGFRDPDGWYTVYAVMPFVMLIDKKKLGGLQAPRRWSDLLETDFRDKIIISGMEDQVADIPLIYLYKEHGEVGLQRLAANLKAVWPEDGAYASPLYLLVEESRMKEMAAITDYVTGPELGRKSALSCFPSLNPRVDNSLPEDASFKWLGWDYIKANDPAEAREYAHTVFISEAKKAGKRGKQ